MTSRRSIFGFVGFSGSGKSRLILGLISEYRKRGHMVGVVKHTHHTISGEKVAGDAEKFVAAGADEVLLVADDTVTRWVGGGAGVTTPRNSASPEDIASFIATNVVLVEGFKGVEAWPRVALWRTGGEVPPLEGVIAVVTDAELTTSVPRFRSDDVPALADFLDTIAAGQPS